MNGVEVLVVEVPKEPEDTWPDHLPHEEHKRGQIEDKNHANKPVDEHHCAWGTGQTCPTTLHRGSKQSLSRCVVCRTSDDKM